MLQNFANKNANWMYGISRMLVGLLFFMHGAQKLFGMFGGKVAPLTSLFGVAGLIEVIGGLFLIVGLFVRLTALVGAVEMLVAFFMMHAPNGWNPLANFGEAAVLYFAAFLLFFVYGAKTWCLEKALLGKEHF